MEENGFDKEIEEEDTTTIKKFVLEISGKLRNSSTVEFTNYEDALQLFDQQSKDGKNLILYEVHKSPVDGTVVKKVPVLNTSKHVERMKALEEEAKANALTQPSVNTGPSISSVDSNSQKNKMTFSNMKYKIFILVAVLGGLILTLLMMNMIASIGSGGTMAGHSILYESIQSYYKSLAAESQPNIHQNLISVYFMI
ncbi:hypothetical protein [Candidatus Nitrosocosmicus sp. SS]|jgi:hypothetical protein|uniref:hypothetical protein n=1 Tax=Candidatus Nitrosocosmicus agrestis TaxID=2563600 RepID=UPI00122E98A9|nr:hypothetical protein [Candidatus Nitrosocosmicus sp. SS]KAA2279357.1 hypothetical protein F1Z66_13655 [Candidatus Nitrosocosmicus sp. SS]KAF0867850.1 hypothetical protein E5N71_13195 [Candidatus Nitrosocosmicus sp. SS]